MLLRLFLACTSHCNEKLVFNYQWVIEGLSITAPAPTKSVSTFCSYVQCIYFEHTEGLRTLITCPPIKIICPSSAGLNFLRSTVPDFLGKRSESLQFVYVIGLHAVQFSNNWMKKILRTAKIGRGRIGRVQFGSTVRGIFWIQLFQIGQACSPITN